MLTGRYFFKQTMLGLVLMVEIEDRNTEIPIRFKDNEPRVFVDKCWRKALPQDLLDLKINLTK